MQIFGSPISSPSRYFHPQIVNCSGGQSNDSNCIYAGGFRENFQVASSIGFSISVEYRMYVHRAMNVELETILSKINLT